MGDHCGQCDARRTHSYAACAEGTKWGPCVLKLDLPETPSPEDFLREVTVLQAAQGRGYA